MRELLYTDTRMPDEELADKLTSTVEGLYERHLATAKVWSGHELIPWSEGRDYVPGEVWDPGEYLLPEAVRSAIKVNTLTEDNLPYYTEMLLNTSGPDPEHPWKVWVGRWTAEEWRHAAVMRDWIHIKRPIDPQELEADRMVQMSKGQIPRPPNLPEVLVYTSLQELATRVAHSNTGQNLLDSAGKAIMGRVAGDEWLHHVFYRDLAKAAIEIDPDTMVIAAARQILHFEMPGTGIPDFENHAKKIAAHGIYDIPKYIHIVLEPTLEKWGLLDLTHLSPEAALAQKMIQKRLKLLGRAAAIPIKFD